MKGKYKSLTRDELQIEDMEVADDLNSVDSQIALLIDAEERFGVDLSDDSARIMFYAIYSPTENSVSFDIYVSKTDGCENIEYDPTESEKELVISMMESYCQSNNNCSITELLQQYNKEELPTGEMTL